MVQCVRVFILSFLLSLSASLILHLYIPCRLRCGLVRRGSRSWNQIKRPGWEKDPISGENSVAAFGIERPTEYTAAPVREGKVLRPKFLVPLTTRQLEIPEAALTRES